MLRQKSVLSSGAGLTREAAAVGGPWKLGSRRGSLVGVGWRARKEGIMMLKRMRTSGMRGRRWGLRQTRE